jgi:hypothetical protein
MAFKEKIVGLVLIIAGLFPFVLKVPAVSTAFVKYTFLTYLAPGEIAYQAIIVVLGILLVWKPKRRRVEED